MKSKSSKQWLQEHFDDEFVQRAKKEGYRARAAYKLLELQAKDRLIEPGMTIVDLGAAPGSWSQVASKLLKNKGKIFALDILPMEPLEGVDFIEGDFTEQGVFDALLSTLDGKKIDLVLSDMAPNISGISVSDQAKAMYLVDLAVDFSKRVLKQGGCLVVKVFQGEGFDSVLKELRANFKRVCVRKPKASRARSREVYFVAKGYNI